MSDERLNPVPGGDPSGPPPADPGPTPAGTPGNPTPRLVGGRPRPGSAVHKPQPERAFTPSSACSSSTFANTLFNGLPPASSVTRNWP
jgi:hypothetical protein